MRIWVDFTNTAHVIVLRPLVERLEAAGHDVALTARPLSHTVELLEEWGRPHTVIGRHGGVHRRDKALAAADRVRRLLGWARGRRFDRGLAHGSTDLPPVARLLGFPNTTMFDYEWAALQHHVNCRLATRVLVPDAIPPGRLARYGAATSWSATRGSRRSTTCRTSSPTARCRRRSGPEGERSCASCAPRRPTRSTSAGRRPRCSPRCCAARRPTSASAPSCWPAPTEQRADVRALGLDRVVVPERTVDGRSLVALADVLVSAGGTMNREAAVLGTPVWSMFEGPLGGVDEQLVREGRLKLLADAGAIDFRPKPAGRWRTGCAATRPTCSPSPCPASVAALCRRAPAISPSRRSPCPPAPPRRGNCGCRPRSPTAARAARPARAPATGSHATPSAARTSACARSASRASPPAPPGAGRPSCTCPPSPSRATTT